MKINLPPVFAIDESWNGNPIRQLHQPARLIVAGAADYTSRELKGKLILPSGDAKQRILVLTKPLGDLKDFDSVIQTKLDGFEGGGDIDLSGAKWLKHSLCGRDFHITPEWLCYTDWVGAYNHKLYVLHIS